MDPRDFRRVAGRFATGVAVVSTVADGVDHAMTVNAFSSVSLEPLLVLFCAEKIARFHAAVLTAGRWAVSVLPESAQDVSQWFATRGRPLGAHLGDWRFERGPMTGAAIFSGALASLECRTHAVHDGGDHSIVVGEVLGAHAPETEDRPLLYYGGRYQRLT
ncbi:flavin reductase (DIM6/NTAB) family NADH-FMN oxidoreductase RutF [Thermomonospora umbrina]|uniref:Flavin reductase (DIM6/NTAB) family NADH-FMN oxidoreductase RutF n=1 Tax=Thermomonospora umbrina TaxID=111806 RepID=A0A3D9SJC0_9ACTN|nr:flavin reductase (DIM6/NTAB) family NADH-FMN oxidoreductase RutF [Thermomonospora umbrina]